MGKKIDLFVLSVFTAACFYLYFFQATRNQFVSILLALFSFLVIKKLLKRVSNRLKKSPLLRKRQYRKQTSGILMKLACAKPEEALAQIQKSLERAYRIQCKMDLIQAHPLEKLSCGTVFAHWKQHRGEDQLLLCATCNCDEDARMLAASLESPKIAILDSEQLKQIILEHPDDFANAEQGNSQCGHLRRIRLLQCFLNRRNAPRCVLFSVSSLMLYLMSDNLLYLLSAMSLLFFALISLRYKPRRIKLF